MRRASSRGTSAWHSRCSHGPFIRAKKKGTEEDLTPFTACSLISLTRSPIVPPSRPRPFRLWATSFVFILYKPSQPPAPLLYLYSPTTTRRRPQPRFALPNACDRLTLAPSCFTVS